ncbi:AAA family ATPase [Gilliamella mensalis]|uniref:AAA family ATPase n=1 Tax=Gilliamella mensalis TaxID=1908520 RepID=UPI000A160069|nr:AAA family ATPase [Gilliamella mensalis]
MDGIKTYWFLGAKFKGSKDQTEHFISSGIWQNGYDNKLLDIVKSISVGDKVAIKSTYNQKNNLPFDNKGLPVSVMEIKAIGTVTKNHGDGKLLEVDWYQTNLNKKWYFYTYIAAIWGVKEDFWLSKQLINFAFYDQPQDIDAFRNAPYWKSRYGDNNLSNNSSTNANEINEPINDSWLDIVLKRIKQLCYQKNSNIFTRSEFLEHYKENLQLLFPNNNTIESTIDNRFQELRNNNILLFLGGGKYKLLDIDTLNEEENYDNQDMTEPVIIKQSYTQDDLINEGCFIDKQQLQAILKSLRLKKNIILQGPPGTGKTWLAKRLANIIVGYKDSKNIKAIQFHPNMSYEDFIRGYRPTSDGKLALIDGPFLEIINQARNDAQSNYVIVIEEINRGNPAQIFGEMLTLLEADKRNPNEALELTYQHQNEKGVFIPANLYVIGTMNIADRSLAMLDFALRRRFAFYHLSPHFGENWLNYMQEKNDFSPQQLQDIKHRIEALNQYISNDSTLGNAFTIGHSYFTCLNQEMAAQDWFEHIVRSEIEPLLEEYWFGEPEKLSNAMNILLDDAQ